MSKDSIYILLRNNYQDIQAKHEKKKACFENNQVEGKKKKNHQVSFLKGRGGIIINRKVLIYIILKQRIKEN